MIDLVRRNIVIVALLLLAWFGYSDLDHEAEKATGATKSALRSIEPKDVDAREPDPDLVLARDPYVAKEEEKPATAAADGGAAAEASATGSGHGGRGATAGSHAPRTTGAAKPGGKSAGGAKGAGGAADGGTGNAAQGAPGDPAQFTALAPGAVLPGGWMTAHARSVYLQLLAAGPPPAPFTLHLQATLALPGGGQARLNGQTLAVGESLAGVDPAWPPVLASVQGPVVVVRHRGRPYVLDLDHRPSLEVAGAPGAPVAASAGSGTGGGQGATPKAAPPKAPKAAPAAPAGGAPAPKKATYKARGYPSKKKP